MGMAFQWYRRVYNKIQKVREQIKLIKKTRQIFLTPSIVYIEESPISAFIKIDKDRKKWLKTDICPKALLL